MDADDYNLNELNKLPNKVDDQVIWIDPPPFMGKVVLNAKDDSVPQASESRDPELYRQQYNRLDKSEFWDICLAAKEITLKFDAQV